MMPIDEEMGNEDEIAELSEKQKGKKIVVESPS
jgi:hypothetical protein